MFNKKNNWRRKLLRYRQMVQGYTLYIVAIALFLSLFPLLAQGIIRDVSFVLTFLAILYVVFTKRHLVDKFSWIILLLILPFFGLFLFWFIGRAQMHPKTYKFKLQQEQKYWLQNQRDPLDESVPFFQIMQICPSSTFSHQTSYQFLSGAHVYEGMLHDLRRAQQSIHIEIYISRYDDATRKLFDLLKQKAQQGVDVRFLADVYGHTLFPNKRIEELVNAGIEFVFFNQGTRNFSDHFHVNHRKNIVIDNRIAYTGGYNLGAEYVYGLPKKKLKWFDLMARLEGDVVLSIQKMFILDWCFSLQQKEHTLLRDFLLIDQPISDQPLLTTTPVTQFLSDGPDRAATETKDLLRYLIHTATKRIYITTPYLIPPEEILHDLKLASQLGLDVRIILPGVPDKKLIYMCSQGNVETLLQSGVKIYCMNDHFVHSKLFLFDDSISVIGTVNLDMRSLFLNFEEMIIEYNNENVNEQLTVLFLKVLQSSEQLQYEKWTKRHWLQKMAEKFLRVFTPLF